MNRQLVSVERVKELLNYDQLTGVFTWREVSRRGQPPVGSIAGTIREDGRINISVDGRYYRAHRLAWLFVYGAHPKQQIDHMDGNPKNNAISNLRDVNTSVNLQNQRKAQTDNSSGYLGVSFHAGRFEARICLNGKDKYLGRHDSAELAHAAYLKEKRQLHEGNTL